MRDEEWKTPWHKEPYLPAWHVSGQQPLKCPITGMPWTDLGFRFIALATMAENDISGDDRMYRPEATSYSLDSPVSITLDVHHRTIRRMPWGHWTLEPVRKLKCTSGTQGLSLVTPVNHGQPWMKGGCITCSPWQIGKCWRVSRYPWSRSSQ